MGKSENAELNYCYNCMYRLQAGEHICPVCGYDNSVRQNDNSSLPEGTILNGRFLVGKTLGQGGFGITYLGVDVKLKVVRVAIKEYFPSGLGVRIPGTLRITANTEKNLEGYQKGCIEFQNEAVMLAGVNSPNIVNVRDYFLENGTAYIVMDYVDGRTLTEEAEANGGRLPWERVLSLFEPLILELDRLHQKKIIHRDIKPDNLKITVNEKGEERLVLLDFGAARNFISSEITKTYTAMVTHGFAPFEQYSTRSHQGPYTDIYALCATMYAAITGTVPPAATDRIEGEVELQPISSFGIDITEQVEKAILHGLAVRKGDRPQTMKELYDELTGRHESAGNADAETPEEKITFLQKDWNRTKRQDSLPERPESAKRKNQWVIPLLLVVLLAGGFLVWNSMRSNVRHIASTQTAVIETQTKIAEIPALGNTEEPIYADPILSDEINTQLPADTDTAVPTDTSEPAAADTTIPTTTDTPEPAAADTTIPTSTDTAIPTDTPEPTATDTPVSTSTDTPLPTNTMKPTSTDTAVPTDTPEPTATNTPTITPSPVPVTVSAGDIITFGKYEQDNNLSNGAEPVEWLVLSVENDRALVISKYGLDAKKYNETLEDVTWETSTLRQWLNEDFYQNTFSDREKSGILQVTNDNPNNPKYGTPGGNKTTDRIFLLSVEEANQYFQDDNARSCKSTAYAAANGVYINKSNGNSLWWLRSPGYETGKSGNRTAIYVMSTGYFTQFGNHVTSVIDAVRPALWLNLPGLSAIANVRETPSFIISTATPTPIPRVELKNGDVITLGKYEQDNNLSNGAEPVEWQVLSVENDRALVISRYGLDAKRYNETLEDVTWETSTLRQWLNDVFYDSVFSNLEKNGILQVTNVNPDNEVYGTPGGAMTIDRLFLLSVDELNQYFKDDSSRICKATDFAKSNGANVNNNMGNAFWWLRSPGYRRNNAEYVAANGKIYTFTTGNRVDLKNITVRPVFWLNYPDNSASANENGTPPITLAGSNDALQMDLKAGETITFGQYEQDNRKNNGQEAIEWQVLAVENDQALLISRYALDVKPYNPRFVNVSWETSSIRKWLNGDFYNSAFSEEEKAQIQEVSVDNASTNKTSGGRTTTDKVFLLSIAEANKYFKTDSSRSCKATAYARANNAYNAKSTGNTWWWLRSPGNSSKNASYVYNTGKIRSEGLNVHIDSGAVRPAIRVKFSGETGINN